MVRNRLIYNIYDEKHTFNIYNVEFCFPNVIRSRYSIHTIPFKPTIIGKFKVFDHKIINLLFHLPTELSFGILYYKNTKLHRVYVGDINWFECNFQAERSYPIKKKK